MIAYIERKFLDIKKYDSCIANSKESKIFAFSWYLDIVADNWAVLVLDNYKAVMPIPYRKKYGIKYVYPPFWALELGVFSQDNIVDLLPFFNLLLKKIKFTEIRLNTKNTFKNKNVNLIEKRVQKLSIQNEYDTIYNSYRKDRKKDLNKSKKAGLVENWASNTNDLITLFKNNVGKRSPKIKTKDYLVLKKLMTVCIEKKIGEILTIKDDNNLIVASGFFLKYKDEITILVSSTDFKNRKNGANTFLIDRVIYKYHKKYKVFNFGGSSINTIANYFLSFGAKTENYYQFKYNNLPFWIKIFKKL